MNLETALHRAAAGLHRTEPRYRPAQLRDFSFADRQALAEYISGSNVRASQQYRTAMREIQRLERGQIRQVGPKYLSRFNAYATKIARTYISVDFSGTIQISADVEHRNIRNVGRRGWLLPESALDTPAAFEDRMSGFFAAYFGQVDPPMFLADPLAPDAVDSLRAEYV